MLWGINLVLCVRDKEKIFRRRRWVIVGKRYKDIKNNMALGGVKSRLC